MGYRPHEMGAWGEKAFQNDAAVDWLDDLEEGGPATLRDTLSRVVDTAEDDEVDVDDGASAIAAAEIVAAALGCGRDRLPIAAGAWLDRHPGVLTVEDRTLAYQAVNRVLGGSSELRALWDESGPESAWHTDVRVLVERLGGKGAAAAGTASASHGREASRPKKVDERSKQVLLTFLSARGLEPTPKQMLRIRASQDPEEIRRWLAGAVDAPSVAAVLDD